MPRVGTHTRNHFFQQGLVRGSRLCIPIQANLANFWAACASLRIEKSDAVAAARKLAQDYSDTLIQEIRGLAHGSGVDTSELLAFNLCHGAVFPDECTVMFAMGDSTTSGKSLFMKNSDKIGSDSMVGTGFYQNKEINVVLVSRPDDGPAVVGVSAAGSTGLKMGVNDRGVTVGANISRTVELAERQVDTTQMRALDRIQLAREGLARETALEAANLVAAQLSAHPMATPGNIEFIDADTGVIIEGSYDRYALQVIQSGIASRSNCFVVLKDLNNPRDVSSRCRYVRTQQLLLENQGSLTPEMMQRFSQDHTNGPGPNSICRHGNSYVEETSQSSMVVEIDGEHPRATRYWIALGKPCHAWRHPEAWLEGTVGRLDDIPREFMVGDTWKRFWLETPYLENDSQSGSNRL